MAAPPMRIATARLAAVLMVLAACGDAPPDAQPEPDACHGPDAAHGATDERTRFAAALVAAGESCLAEVQTRRCDSGVWQAWSGTFTSETCEVAAPGGCSDPVANPGAHDLRIRYQDAVVPFGQTCRAEEQTRLCDGGVWQDWSGTFTSETCEVAAPIGCSGPDAPHGGVDQRQRFERATVPHGETCRAEAQTRTCDNGTWQDWSGTFTSETCEVAAARACTSPDMPHGGIDRRDAFETRNVPYGETCRWERQTRTCDDGQWSPWSGRYRYEWCDEPVVTALTASPRRALIEADRGETLPVVATATVAGRGNQDVSAVAAWRSANPSIAVVDSSGRVQGIAPGSTFVTVRAGSHEVIIPITVQRWTMLSVAPLSGDAAHVDFASDGAAITALWTDAAAGDRQIARLRTWSGLFGEVETAIADAAIDRTALAVNQRGDVTVLSHELDADGTSALRARTRAAGATAWSSPVSLLADAPSLFAVVSHKLGNAVAMWAAGDGFRASAFAPTGGWELPAPVMSGATDPRAVAVDADGQLIALAYRSWSTEPAGHALYANHYRRGAAPTRATLYRHEHGSGGPGTDTIGDFRVAYDDDGGAVAVWVHGVGSERELVAARYRDGVWQAATAIAQLGSADVALGTLAARNGTVALAFTSSRDGATRVYVTVAPRGQPWTAPAAVSPSGHDVVLGDRDRPIAVGNDGAVVVLWTQRVDRRDHVFLRRHDADVGWHEPRDLGQGGGHGPVAAFVVPGGFAVGWVEGGDIVDGELTPATVRAAVFR